jgi:hypothetical protein
VTSRRRSSRPPTTPTSSRWESNDGALYETRGASQASPDLRSGFPRCVGINVSPTGTP